MSEDEKKPQDDKKMKKPETPSPKLIGRDSQTSEFKKSWSGEDEREE